MEPTSVKKTMSDYAKELHSDIKLTDQHYSLQKEATKQMREFIESKKTEMLLAWWSEYGFNPGETILVLGHNDEGQYFTGLRKQTPEEAEMIKRAAIPSATLEQIVSNIYKKWIPKTKIETQEGRHGSDKGEIHEVTFYFDETKGEWTLKEFAFEGYLRKVLQPIIQNAMKSDSEAKE